MFLKLIVLAILVLINAFALFKPSIVSFNAALSPRTLIYALHVFKSGATYTSVTLVRPLILGSLTSLLIMLLSSLRTSLLILIFFILFFLRYSPVNRAYAQTYA